MPVPACDHDIACAHVQDIDGENCLHKAARAGNSELVQLLMRARGGSARAAARVMSTVDGGDENSHEQLAATCDGKGLVPWQVATNAHVIALLKPYSDSIHPVLSCPSQHEGER